MTVLAQAVLLLALEVVVRAVVIDDLVLTRSKLETVLVYGGLDVVALPGQQRQGPVYLMDVRLGLFYEALGVLQR